ncbi:MAG: hypothetical protein HYR55_06925 [Acidobacteria bacterium]|nr:hypothetical protein [Acidobacteriota bacterium]MBI3655220.1 hypothetical protein [Acidobacteriota bacterium]
MLIRSDPALMEEIVFWEIKRREEQGDLQIFRTYHQLADAIYEEPSTIRREVEFAKLHEKFFRVMGFETLIAQVLSEFAPLAGKVAEVFVARAIRPQDEGADLSHFGNRIGIKIRAERFRDAESLKTFMRHEFYHVADMLDPTFGYEPNDVQQVSSPAEESLLRDRYKVLWNILIESRLRKAGKPTMAGREERFAEFEALYQKLPLTPRVAVFDVLWSAEQLTHRDLIEMASNTEYLLERTGTRLDQGGERPSEAAPLPGSKCPLCRFPSYTWGRVSDEITARRIQEDFHDWSPSYGVCVRCIEAYESQEQFIGR